MVKTRLWFIIILAFISTGCSSVVKAEQPAVLDSVKLDDTISYGQTFKAHFDALDGIEIYLSPLEIGTGRLQLHLRQDAQSPENMALVSLPLTEISAPGFYRFQIPVQANSNQLNYYLLLKIKGTGSIDVGTAPGDTYLNGSLYQGNQPNNEGQLAFQLSYYIPRLALGLVREILLWGWHLLISAFLFIPPGWAILDYVLVSNAKKMGWGTKLALSVGISLALYPIIVLLVDSLGLRLGVLYAWVPSLISLSLILWRRRRYLDSTKAYLLKIQGKGDVGKTDSLFSQHPRPTFLGRYIQTIHIQLGWINLTLISVILIIFASRFWIIRMLEVPLWGDSLQHAMITQLILDNNGLFASWQPYTPYYSLTTHFGFSFFAALFAWISGMNATQATLWMGQIINGLAILTLYPLAVKISRGSHWAGIAAMVAGGLFSTLPAAYVNWGRFAQLAGQAVLPVAIWLLWEALDRHALPFRREWARLLLAGMVLTGMLLSYYRMPFYYVTFVAVLLLFRGLPEWRFNWKTWSHILIRLLLIGMIGVGLFIPWGTRLIGGNLADAVGAGVAAGTPADRIIAQLKILQETPNYVSMFSWVTATIAVFYALLRKNWIAAALPLWFVLLVGYMAGAYIQLPAANMLQGFAILIAVYIPIALMIGWLLGEIISLIEKNKRILAAVCIFTILASAWLGWQQRMLLDLPNYALVTPPDLKAMTWIEKQTPDESYFLVQGFQYWQTAAGSDAGWWIPLLANRGNMLPPQYAQFNEVSRPPDFTQRVVDLVILLRENGITDPMSITALCDWGITHIYHGQQQGQAGGPQLYSSRELKSAPELFSLLYHQDRVSIFALRPTACHQQ